jgi:hypothetical protein
LHSAKEKVLGVSIRHIVVDWLDGFWTVCDSNRIDLNENLSTASGTLQ